MNKYYVVAEGNKEHGSAMSAVSTTCKVPYKQ